MRARTFRLTPDLVAAHSGGPVVCLDARALGHSYRLHSARPGPETNRRLGRDGLAALRAEVVSAEGVLDLAPPDPDEPTVTRVEIRGVLEQRAGYHDPCGGWTDGHDAIRERLEAAFEDGDVFLVVDSPGGAGAGLDEAVQGALRAKAAHGRRVIAFVDPMCGSACTWWVLALADEIYLPRAGVLGSIGVRSSHWSIAGQLAMEGEEVTYFAAPGPGKVAWAPELPLSDEGKRRGERDVWQAYEIFEATVCGGPVGQRYGLTPEKVRALDADALTGQAAVDAGLADAVASLEDVESYALALASGGGDMTLQASKDPNKDPDPEEPDEGEGEGGEEELEQADKRECSSCGQANEEDAEFCKKCGGKMATGSPSAEEEPPPSSRRAPPQQGHPPPPQERRTSAARPRLTSAATFEEILGLRKGASMPAAKAAALAMRGVVDRVAAITGTRNIGEMIGGLDRIEQDLGRLVQVEAAAKRTRVEARARERVEILKELVAIGGAEHARGKLLVDVVDDKGQRIGVRPTELWGAGPKGRTLENLRGYLKQARASAPASPRRTPYEPGLEQAEQAAREAASGARVTDRDRELASATGLDPKALAASGAALFGPNGAAKAALPGSARIA